MQHTVLEPNELEHLELYLPHSKWIHKCQKKCGLQKLRPDLLSGKKMFIRKSTDPQSETPPTLILTSIETLAWAADTSSLLIWKQIACTYLSTLKFSFARC